MSSETREILLSTEDQTVTGEKPHQLSDYRPTELVIYVDQHIREIALRVACVVCSQAAIQASPSPLQRDHGHAACTAAGKTSGENRVESAPADSPRHGDPPPF